MVCCSFLQARFVWAIYRSTVAKDDQPEVLLNVARGLLPGEVLLAFNLHRLKLKIFEILLLVQLVEISETHYNKCLPCREI